MRDTIISSHTFYCKNCRVEIGSKESCPCCGTSTYVVEKDEIKDEKVIFSPISKHKKAEKFKPRKEQCPYCYTVFEQESELESHIKNHISDIHPKIKEVKCLYCNKLFTTEEGRNQHIRYIHPNGQNVKLPEFKIVKCLYCDRLFISEFGFNFHIRDMHPNRETANEYHGIAEKAEKAEKANEYNENFTCGYCGMKCSSRTALEEHVISWKHQLIFS
jgi:uncharacterized Zn-finger protein